MFLGSTINVSNYVQVFYSLSFSNTLVRASFNLLTLLLFLFIIIVSIVIIIIIVARVVIVVVSFCLCLLSFSILAGYIATIFLLSYLLLLL